MLSEIQGRLPEFRQLLGSARLDGGAFLAKMADCSFNPDRCYCCSMGAYLESAESEKIKELLRTKKDFFRYLGDEGAPLVKGRSRHNKQFALKPCSYSGLEGLDAPHHHSACSMRDAQGRCSLQALAISEGHHPWWYKPLECWIFPLVIVRKAEGYIITLAGRVPQLYAKEEIPDFTLHATCAKEDANGTPAYLKFAHELAMLSELLGRDLSAEIHKHAVTADAGTSAPHEAPAAP